MRAHVMLFYLLFTAAALPLLAFFIADCAPRGASSLPRPIVLAHRGLEDLAPENSLAAVREAILHGADGCEMDVHLAKSGEVIVLHDPSVERVSDGHGYVKDLTLAEIKSFRLDPDPAKRHPEERIPTLEEMLRTFGGKAVLFIEMKRPKGMEDAGDGMEAKVGALIDRMDLYGSTFVSSFNPRALALIKKAYPKVRTVLEYHKGAGDGLPRPDWLKTAETYGKVYAIGPEISAATEKAARWARDHGYRLSTFSPTTLDEMEKARRLGFDIVTTHRPELYRMVLKGLFTTEGLARIAPSVRLDFEGPAELEMEPGGVLSRSEGTARTGRAALAVAVDGEGGAYVDLPAEPQVLCLLMVHLKAEGRPGKEATAPLILMELKDEAPETTRFRTFHKDRPPSGRGGWIRHGPSCLDPSVPKDAEGWMRARFAFRSAHDTRALRLILGAVDFHGRILVDDLTLRKLPEQDPDQR